MVDSRAACRVASVCGQFCHVRVHRGPGRRRVEPGPFRRDRAASQDGEHRVSQMAHRRAHGQSATDRVSVPHGYRPVDAVSGAMEPAAPPARVLSRADAPVLMGRSASRTGRAETVSATVPVTGPSTTSDPAVPRAGCRLGICGRPGRIDRCEPPRRPRRRAYPAAARRAVAAAIHGTQPVSGASTQVSGTEGRWCAGHRRACHRRSMPLRRAPFLFASSHD